MDDHEGWEARIIGRVAWVLDPDEEWVVFGLREVPKAWICNDFGSVG